MQHIGLIGAGILFVWRGTQGVGQHEPPPSLQQLALAESGAEFSRDAHFAKNRPRESCWRCLMLSAMTWLACVRLCKRNKAAGNR